MSAARRLCALNLSEVVETFRPLPIVSVAGAPSFVRGLSIVRGNSIAVVDLCALLGADTSERVNAGAAQRMVTLRLGERTVALLVDSVLGVRGLDASQLARAPGLMGEAASELLSALGQLDEQLLVVLRSSHLVPAEVWALLAEHTETTAAGATTAGTTAEGSRS